MKIWTSEKSENLESVTRNFKLLKNEKFIKPIMYHHVDLPSGNSRRSGYRVILFGYESGYRGLLFLLWFVRFVRLCSLTITSRSIISPSDSRLYFVFDPKPILRYDKYLVWSKGMKETSYDQN